MEKITLPTQRFKFLIYNRLINVFDEEIKMEIAEKILGKYEFISITPENCIYGNSHQETEFIKHKNHAFQMLKALVNSK